MAATTVEAVKGAQTGGEDLLETTVSGKGCCGPRLKVVIYLPQQQRLFLLSLAGGANLVQVFECLSVLHQSRAKAEGDALNRGHQHF